MSKKKKILVIGLVILLILLFGPGIYTRASILFDSDEVGYDNTTSDMQSVDVQSALDELYTMVNSVDREGSFGGTRFVYRWSTSSWTNESTNISSLTMGSDYWITQMDVVTVKTNAEKYYLRHNVDNGIVIDSYAEFIVSASMAGSNSGMTAGTYILRGGDLGTSFSANKAALISAFGSANCIDNTTNFTCSTSALTADVDNEGNVQVGDAAGHCDVNDSGISSCQSGIVSFADDSWATIIAAIQNGDTSLYHVGDTKSIDLGTLGTHTLRIANMSTPSACSGSSYSQTACGFVKMQTIP